MNASVWIQARSRREDVFTRTWRCVFFGWLLVIIIVILVLAVIGLMSLVRGRA
jgi:hypothetical protein